MNTKIITAKGTLVTQTIKPRNSPKAECERIKNFKV